MTTLLAHFSILALLSYGMARRLVQDPLDRVLGTAMLFWANIVLHSLLLSVVGKLGEVDWFFRGSLLLGLASFTLVKYLVTDCKKGIPQPTAPPAETRSRLLITAVFGTLFLMLLANLRIASSYAPNNYDSLTYHLPRVMYYLGQNSLAHFETDDIRQVFFTFNFNLLQLFCFIYSPPEETINFLNVSAWVISGLAIYRITRLGGCSFNSSLAATWLTLTATEILAQATSTTLDLPTAAALLSAIVFGLRWRQTQQTRDAMLAGISAGLCAGAKLTIVFFGPTAVLLLIYFWYQSWSQAHTRRFNQNIRIWIIPGLIAIILTVPFIIYNLTATGQWMTKELDFTLNKPFSFACALQTAKGYLIQLVFEPLGRFSFDMDQIRNLNDWFSRNVFKNWNDAYAYSGLYLCPPDLNEDHVWYGFAGPLIMGCAIISLWRDRRLHSPLSWLALLGLGWFITYFAMNKWSLYIQRYFLPALMLMGPSMAVILDHGRLKSTIGGLAKRFLFYSVAATSLWFSYVYITQNHNRPFSFPYTNFNPPQVLPNLPPALLSRIPAQSRININTYGTNERIYLLMNLGQNQRFTSGTQVDPQKYNVFSYWGFTRNNIYSNIAYTASYTLVNIPTKATAGVEALGTIGEGVNAFDYVGLVPHANDNSSTLESNNIVVCVEYAPKDPTRFAKSVLRVYGLNPNDHAKLNVTAELDDGTKLPVATLTESGVHKISITQSFKRLAFQVVEASTDKTIGFGELPYTTKPTVADAPEPISATTLFRSELIGRGGVRNLSVNGLADLEGPYDQWSLPLFRWAKQPIVRIEVPENKNLKRLQLSFSLRLQMRDESHLEVLHNGKLIQDFWLIGKTAWHDKTLTITPSAGDNIIELRDHPSSTIPDWLAYLEEYPDVKNYLVSEGKALEAGAQEHYEGMGRSEGRKLTMKPNPAIMAPPPESLYFIYRSLKIEGLTD